MGIQENEKALRYIAQLDEARCNARWQEVPELARKVEKHASHRRCLTLTARSEAQVAAYSIQRPSTAASTASSTLSKIIPALLTAIDDNAEYPQDAFEATVCLGWLHFVLDEPGLAVARLPKDFGVATSKLASGDKALSKWTQACIIKGAYLKGFSQEKVSSTSEAVNTYNSVLPFLSSFSSFSTTSPQFRLWVEQLLGRLCLLSDQSSSSGRVVQADRALRTFRMWSRFWDSSMAGSDSSGTGSSRTLVWKAYYDTLSTIVQRGLRYSPASTTLQPQLLDTSEKLPVDEQLSSRLQQRAELKRVEAVYESLLLKETEFPKASETNKNIEVWVEAVMDNWRVLCGPSWHDEELGEGGKGAVGRGVLDILYRAATKTFHSTQILRHLFTVHASLAEFDLAFKAYDSYAEIVTRGKDRAEKSGEEDISMDDDGTILRTAAEAIRILCRFGSRKEAEKARDIGQNIEKLLKQHTPSITLHKPTPTDRDVAKDTERPTKHQVAPRTLAVAYRAVGISQAQWARLTYEAGSRTSIQTKAVHYLRKAIEPRFQDSHNLDAHYALGLVLAEMRDVPGAIKIVKRALSPVTGLDSSISTDDVISNKNTLLTTEYSRERKLIPLWHLLALLLTARSEFTTAAKSCEAAFEQFESPTILFGSADNGEQYRSDHLNQLSAGTHEEKPSKSCKGVVDQMEAVEKGGIVEIKMTQLSLVEIIEGPNVAVDGSDELLALYARLFGDPDAGQTKSKAPATPLLPPKSSAGTIKGSIFRSRTARKTVENTAPVARNSSIASSRPSTVATQATAAPTIQVTDEDGSEHANGHHHLFHSKHHTDIPTQKRSGSVKLQKKSAGSLRRRAETEGDMDSRTHGLDGTITNGKPGHNSSVREKSPRRPSMSSSIRKSTENERPLRPILHNTDPAVQPPPVGYSKQPPHRDTRRPPPLPPPDYIPPDPRFTVLMERRHKISLLVKVWLFISGLYTRAAMYEDAKGAVDEAFKLVEKLELEVAQESFNTKAFADPGWGVGKSVEELWGDVWAERGELLLAQSSPHAARSDFEKALSHFPDHPVAIVGLSNILLDIYCDIIPPEPPLASGPLSPLSPPFSLPISATEDDAKKILLASSAPSAENQISPPELNRLAARDRAHGLLSTLTKLGSGWDYSEAWFALARAYEEGGQIEKAKEVLWWCVELEDSHPAREWGSVAVGGFVL
ncbi:filamentation protein-like protein [Lepidopterella palustris CBS 459.81]|uniref:Filamentation protein-like protein n=1 Tax=Lepidopterella palustris CBS 459.81 TaxID=1314670 RepID=A0A8E2E657_9PEZI|nr:filamentation protein-like protein [Lepidopterella palustris CBS 459.81]